MSLWNVTAPPPDVNVELAKSVDFVSENISLHCDLSFPFAGEELTIDYGYVYYLTEKQQRQLSLKSQYFFECVCVACRNNWPLRSKLASGIPTFK